MIHQVLNNVTCYMQPNNDAANKKLFLVSDIISKSTLAAIVGSVVLPTFNNIVHLPFDTHFLTPSFLYMNYNTHQFSENLKTYARNPKDYTRTLSGKLDEAKIRKCLNNKTFCFGWATDLVVNSLKNQKII